MVPHKLAHPHQHKKGEMNEEIGRTEITKVVGNLAFHQCLDSCVVNMD